MKVKTKKKRLKKKAFRMLICCPQCKHEMGAHVIWKGDRAELGSLLNSLGTIKPSGKYTLPPYDPEQEWASPM